ncbi:MAG TPA: hypothetical protein VLL05_14330 [Terriglobales bacterium]|nr:hypothetical protein [Terriglobales bacterium]
MRRSISSGLLLITLSLAAAAGAQKRLVLSIDGDWWDANGQPLGFARPVNGQCVFGQGGSLQIADAETKAARTIVFEKLGQQCPCAARPQHIPEHARCAEARIDPQHSNLTEASALGGSSLSRIFDWLMRSPQMYVVAAARGLEDEPQEAVLPLSGSEVELSAAMQSLPAATYAISLDLVGGGVSVTSKLAWKPGGLDKATTGRVAPGLYKLSASVEGGESEGAEAWVLVSAPAHFESDAKEFREVAELTRSWGDRVDANAKRAVLRACLHSLAARDAGKPQ